jgi:hypothetical protein
VNDGDCPDECSCGKDGGSIRLAAAVVAPDHFCWLEMYRLKHIQTLRQQENFGFEVLKLKFKA